MKQALLQILRAPDTGEVLQLLDARITNGEVEQATLRGASGSTFFIRGFIPRFVANGNYADSFGLQWNQFRSTQLDSHSGVPISRDRFYSFSGWTPEQLEGRTVLDVGCGAGRFTEIALAAGARVVALDYSSAVDACWANHAFHPNLDVVQADIQHPPFALESFDFIYCFGVLQHTPDPRVTFLSMPPLLKKQHGRLAVDVYPQLFLNRFWPKYWLRPLSRRIAPDRLFHLVQQMVPVLLPVSRMVGRVPRVGRKLRNAIPVVNYEGVYPLTETQIREWAFLDTYDMFAPAHDHPQTIDAVQGWFAEAGMQDSLVERRGFIVGRGRAP